MCIAKFYQVTSFKNSFPLMQCTPVWHFSREENPIITTKSFLKFSLITALEQDYKKEKVLHWDNM